MYTKTELNLIFKRHCSWTSHCEIDVFGNWPNFFLNWPNFLDVLAGNVFGTWQHWHHGLPSAEQWHGGKMPWPIEGRSSGQAGQHGVAGPSSMSASWPEVRTKGRRCHLLCRVDVWHNTVSSCLFNPECRASRVHSHAPSIRSHRGTKVVWPHFQPMRVPEEQVCIHLFRQNPVRHWHI